MLFNGQHPDVVESLSEEDFGMLQIMFRDGMVGNNAVFDALSPITAAIYNYFRSDKNKVIAPKDVFPWVQAYNTTVSVDERTSEQKQQDAALMFVLSVPGGREALVKKGMIHDDGDGKA